MAQSTAEKTGAEDVRWDLSEMFSSPDDPEIERLLAEALTFATGFEERYKGRIAELSPAEFVKMMEELEAHYANGSKPSLYAHLLHTQDTRNNAAGRLIARTREAGAERGKHMVFFGLEVARLTDEQCAEVGVPGISFAIDDDVVRHRVFARHVIFGDDDLGGAARRTRLGLSRLNSGPGTPTPSGWPSAG